MSKRQQHPNPQKARQHETKAARWLYAANVARDAGKLEQAEKLYAKAQHWHDLMNKSLGNS